MLTAKEKKPWLNNQLCFRICELAVLLCLLVLDQVSKWWAQMHDAAIMNHGGVFGIYPSWWWGVGLMLVWLFLVRHWWGMKQWGVRLGMGMIVAGGLGNIIDRVLFGSVRDFIFYPAFGFYGNVADIILGVGLGVVIAVRYFMHEEDEISQIKG